MRRIKNWEWATKYGVNGTDVTGSGETVENALCVFFASVFLVYPSELPNLLLPSLPLFRHIAFCPREARTSSALGPSLPNQFATQAAVRIRDGVWLSCYCHRLR